MNILRSLPVLAALACGARAGTISDTYYFGPTNISSAIHITPTVLKFDDSLGSLQNITFTLSVTNTASASATNGRLTCTQTACTPGGSLYLTQLGGGVYAAATGPSGLTLESNTMPLVDYGSPGLPVQNIFTSCTGFSCLVDAGNIVNVVNLTATSNTTGDVTGLFDPYHQTGAAYIAGLDLQLGDGYRIGHGDAGLDYTASNSVYGSLQVTYNYGSASGVPEPGTWGLMGSGAGLMAMGIRRRRRQSRAM